MLRQAGLPTLRCKAVSPGHHIIFAIASLEPPEVPKLNRSDPASKLRFVWAGTSAWQRTGPQCVRKTEPQASESHDSSTGETRKLEHDHAPIPKPGKKVRPIVCSSSESFSVSLFLSLSGSQLGVYCRNLPSTQSADSFSCTGSA